MSLDLNQIAVEMIKEYGTHINLRQASKLTGKDSRTIKFWVSTGDFPEQCAPGYWSTTQVLEFTHNHTYQSTDMTADQIIYECMVPETSDEEYWRNKLNN